MSRRGNRDDTHDSDHVEHAVNWHELRKLDNASSLKLSSNELNTADDAKTYADRLRKGPWFALKSDVERQIRILPDQGQETGTLDDRVEKLSAILYDELLEMSFPTANDFTRDASNFRRDFNKLVDKMESIREKTK